MLEMSQIVICCEVRHLAVQPGHLIAFQVHKLHPPNSFAIFPCIASTSPASIMLSALHAKNLLSWPWVRH